MVKHSKSKTHGAAKFNPSYVVIPLITLATGFLGSWATSQGLVWYRSLTIPAWTPSGSAIGTVWTTIYVLATISTVLVWNAPINRKRAWFIMKLFLVNAGLNVFWSCLFFGLQQMGPAIWVAMSLGLSVILLMKYIYPISKPAAWLLLPYALWVSFATYLNYLIWTLNY